MITNLLPAELTAKVQKANELNADHAERAKFLLSALGMIQEKAIAEDLIIPTAKAAAKIEQEAQANVQNIQGIVWFLQSLHQSGRGIYTISEVEELARKAE